MAESKTAVIAALTGNAALAVLKGVAAGVTGSVAMLAESLHSVADTGNQILLFVGLRLADRPPDRPHPFGHGKNVYFWAFVVSMLLFSVGGAFAIWEAVRKILPRCAHRLTRVDLWRPGSRVRLRTRVVRGRGIGRCGTKRVRRRSASTGVT